MRIGDGGGVLNGKTFSGEVLDKVQENQAIELLASGTPQVEVAEALGISQPSISRFAKKNQEIIEKETEKLLKSLPDIMEQTLRDITTGNDISKLLADAAPKVTAAKSKLLDIEEAAVRAGGKKAADVKKSPEYRLAKIELERAEADLSSRLSPFLLDGKTAPKFLSLAYKKQADILRALGVFSAASQSIFIQNLIQKNTTNIISPAVMQVIGEYINKSLEAVEVVEAEVIDEH